MSFVQILIFSFFGLLLFVYVLISLSNLYMYLFFNKPICSWVFEIEKLTTTQKTYRKSRVYFFIKSYLINTNPILSIAASFLTNYQMVGRIV
jgi:hypothetical protein